MKVKLQARRMWDAVDNGDVDDHEDRRALEALLSAAPPKMAFVLAKTTAKSAGDSIASSRFGSDLARQTTLQELWQEWDHLAFRLGKDIVGFTLRISVPMQKLELYGDEDISEERAVEKLLRVIPDKYT